MVNEAPILWDIPTDRISEPAVQKYCRSLFFYHQTIASFLHVSKREKKIRAHKLTPDPQPLTSGLVSPCSQCRSDF